jgi:hypothetical protein
VMRELEGRSYQEISEVLGVSVSAVETLIFRGRRALREQLEESITCHEAELAISRQLDGRLPRKEKGPLRAHLRECDDCARFARSQRAQSGAIKSLALIPLPASLSSFFGHGGTTATAAGGAGAAFGGGVAIKAAALGAGALVATGVGYEGVKKVEHRAPPVAKAAALHAVPARPLSAPVTFRPQVAGTDQKPFRQPSIKARQKHHGRPAVKRVNPGLARGHEKSSLARGRGHVKPAKPSKPGRPANPGSNGQHKGKNHKPHRPPPPPPPSHGKGNGGGGNGHAKNS